MTLPRKGAFVVLSIDPVASLADCEGDDLAALCEGMSNKKYVAYVDRSWPWLFNPFITYHTHDFYPVFQGLPTENLDPLQEPGMCVPILPNTSHPKSRIALDPTTPLPWPDTYLSIFVSFEARVAVQPTQTRPPYLVGPDERVRLDMLMREDRTRRHEIFQIDHPGEHAPPLLPPLEFLVPEIEPEPLSVPFLEDDGTLDQGGDPIPLTDEEELKALLLGNVVVSTTTPVITCSYDFSTVDGITDYKDFYKEVEVLNKIRAGYRERQLQRIKEARRLDDEHFGSTNAEKEKTDTEVPAATKEKTDPEVLASTKEKTNPELLAAPPQPADSDDTPKCNFKSSLGPLWIKTKNAARALIPNRLAAGFLDIRKEWPKI